VTTNRPDAMNHRGLAREAAVAVDGRLRPIDFDLEESDEDAATLATVEIAAPDLCSRYVARIIRGVRICSSPEWIQRRLLNCGVRPINAVVDATNYVLLELGQPLHAFDLDLVRGRRIIVRPAEVGETLTTLDGEERQLDEAMLMIADADGVVALAGIMGGADSEIHQGTSDVLLESAHFDALSVRRTARRLGMHTEASHRFERGTDPEMAAVACDRAAALIAEIAGGRVCKGRIDVNPRPWVSRRMELKVSELSAFTGLEIPAERVVEIFDGLGFAPQRDGDVVRVNPPSHRVDVERVSDLYEEVIRHVGYDAVPSELPILPTNPGRRNANWELIDRARDAAVSAGLTEVLTWSFIGPETDELVASQPMCPGASLPLENPLAQTQDHIVSREERFARLKGIVDDLVVRVGLPEICWQPGGNPWLDGQAGAEIRTDDGTVIGLAGILAREYGERWDLRQEVAVAELDLGLASELAIPRFEPLPRFPAVIVDMTVEHAANVSYAEIKAAVDALSNDWVEGVNLTARYSSSDLGGAVRTTLRLIYRHPERSLTQDEVNQEQERLRAELARDLEIKFA
jgi:phenylalanyl-tRNA synthetase beta chain